jgi:hypothetical protein
MKLHQKGFLLVQLSKAGSLWDHELVAAAMAEYRLAGRHWINTLRVALEELAAAGLVTRIAERLDDGSHVGAGKVLFNYRLSEFGRCRMRDTGLLPEARTS